MNLTDDAESSQLDITPKKKISKKSKGNGEKDVFRSIRSRQESNLRRRIYDAWNVLKAASIIVPRDRSEKYFVFNSKVVFKESPTLEH